jgi:hypothetical protein
MMGLDEKRRLADVVKKAGAVQSEVQSLSGGSMTVEVDEASFASLDANAIGYGPQSLDTISNAIRRICSDELSKNAVKDGVQKIIFKNVGDKAEVATTIEGGTVTVAFALASYSQGGAQNHFAVVKGIEAGL